MRWKWLLGGALVCAVLTCPDLEDHEAEIRRCLQARISGSQEAAMASFFMALMGGGSGGGLLEEVTMSQLQLQCHNCLIFSIGTGVVDGERHPISFGMFGGVLVNDED